MDLYIRFLSILAVGLLGIGTVLRILLDELFVEWDALSDLLAWFRALSEHKGLLSRHERAEDAMLEAERRQAPVANTRMIEQRRERLKELSAVEQRLIGSNQKITITPVPRSPVGVVSAQS